MYLLLAIYPFGCTSNISQPPTSHPLNDSKKNTKTDRLATTTPPIQPTQPAVVNSVLPIAKNPKPNPIFRAIFPALKSQTKIPILLPEYVPEADSLNQVFAILENATPTQYQIMLAFAESCRGGNACRLGSISGEEGIPKSTSTEPEIIDLNITTKAYFIPSRCGANCSDARLSWAHGKYFYTIAIKAGDKNTLIKMANSAIANGSL